MKLEVISRVWISRGLGLFHLVQAHRQAVRVHAPGLPIVGDEPQKRVHIRLLHADAAECLMVGLDDLDQQKVIFEVSELLRRRAVDESGIHRFLLPSLAVEADDADLPSYVLPAQQISARMRGYGVDHAHVLLAGLHQLAVLRGHKVRQYNFLILLGKPDRLFVSLQLIAHLVGDVEGQVRRPAEHLPRRQPFQRAEGHHGRAAPLADDLRLGFLEGLPVGDVHVDVRQAARQDPVRRYEAVLLVTVQNEHEFSYIKKQKCLMIFKNRLQRYKKK